MRNDPYTAFLEIAKQLNHMGITPMLVGTVGLECVTGAHWDPADLDIHVPGDPRGWEAPDEERIYRWPELLHIMTELGFTLLDLHEHAFVRDGLEVSFGVLDENGMDTGVALQDVGQRTEQGARFFLMNPEQFLSMYRAAAKDSFRSNKAKDREIIAYLEGMVPPAARG